MSTFTVYDIHGPAQQNNICVRSGPRNEWVWHLSAFMTISEDTEDKIIYVITLESTDSSCALLGLNWTCVLWRMLIPYKWKNKYQRNISGMTFVLILCFFSLPLPLSFLGLNRSRYCTISWFCSTMLLQRTLQGIRSSLNRHLNYSISN